MSERQRNEAFGRWAERLAAWALRLRGYRIIARRFRTPWGELDLVVRRGRLLAFVEVKARRQLDQALESLGARQRQRTVRAAEVFLQHHPRYRDFTLRFDLIAIAPWRLPRHLRNAWQTGPR